MALQPYVRVDWRKIDTVREAMKKGSILTVRELNGRDARHRATLMSLTAQERAKLAKLDDKLASEMGTAAAFLCEEKRAAEGIALFDDVVRAGHDIRKPSAGSRLASAVPLDATYYLIEKAPPEMKTAERGRLYFDYFRPISSKNTAVLLNLAEVSRDLLKDSKTAIQLLREAIELGDPTIRASLVKDKAGWEKIPGFATLAKAAPTIPPGLRALQLWSDLRRGSCDPGIEYFQLPIYEDDKLSSWLHGVPDASFEVFGLSLTGDRWALWRRDKKAAREDCPVVVFGRSGMIGVYAASVPGMMSLCTTDWDGDDVLESGYGYGDDGWTRPAKLRKLKASKDRVERLRPVAPDAMKRDPENERGKAFALMADFIAEATRNGKESTVRKASAGSVTAKAIKDAKDATKANKRAVADAFDIGFAKVSDADLPPDIAFLKKKGKSWLGTFEVTLLDGKGDPPELLEHFDTGDGDPDVVGNTRAIREVLSMITWAVEAYEDNSTLYGYWRGPEKTPLKKAPIVSFDSEGQFSKEVGSSLLEVLLQKSCYEEEEQFDAWKAKLVKAGVAIKAKGWDDYASRAKWPSDPEKLHEKLYAKYVKEEKEKAKARKPGKGAAKAKK